MSQRFQGVYTALATPFTADHHVDWAAFKRLIQTQLEAKISGIVPCGTTGETPTLSDEERTVVIQTAVEMAKGHCPVIVGTGSNSTAHTVHYTQEAAKLGASAALVVTPYYNKPTQEGLFRHFSAVAQATKLPIILYNVPGRTACDLLPATVKRLSEAHETIVAIKEAAGSTDRIAELSALLPASFSILSGDDSLTLPMMVVGAHGVISVASNVAPRVMMEMVSHALQGDFTAARAVHMRLRLLFGALFAESNPIPLKAALALQKLATDAVRLPLAPANEQTRTLLQRALAELG